MAVFRKLTVTTCDVLRSGVSESGRDWTMYEVYAVDESGTPVEAKLRAFDPLPLNELREYEVTQRKDDRHGTTYTLSYPKGSRPKSAKAQAKDFKQQIAELNLRVENLEQRTEWLLNLIHQLQHAAGAELATEPPKPGPESGVAGAGGAGGALAGDGQIPY